MSDEREYSLVFSTEELEITRLIFERLRNEKCLEELDRETISYRIAEIMSLAKQMYTVLLPRLINRAGESDTSAHDDLVGLQNTFMHACDLMYEYDSAYLKALGHPPPDQAQLTVGLDGQSSP